MSLRLLMASLCVVLTAVSGAMAKEIRISDRVFLVRDRSGAPVEFQMIVNAGCADESGGECRGLAHYLEHLILVGRNPEHNNSAFRFFPDAATNGWTSQIATVYWHRMPQRAEGPRADLEKIFNFYAARLRTFSIPENEAARERNVVLQEHDWRLGSNATARFFRKLDRALLPDHPLGQWTIGTRETIKALTLEEARAFHERWYKRSNVWFVVTGDIEPALLKEISERALKDADPGTVPPRPSLTPPPVTLRRETLLEQDPQARRRLAVVEKLVRIEENDKLATLARATVLSQLLASQLPGSLNDTVAERAKLTTTRPMASLRRIAPETYKLTLAADVLEADDPDGRKLLAALGAYADSLSAEQFSDRNVERIRKRLLDERKTADGIPEQVFQRLVSWLSQGHDPDDIDRLPARIAAVQKSDLAPLLAALAGRGSIAEGILAPKTGE